MSSYQTYDPYRSFGIKHYEFVTDKQIEKAHIKNLASEEDLGEWVTNENAEEIIRFIRDSIEWKQGEYIFKDKKGIPLRLGMKVKFQPPNQAVQYGTINRFISEGVEITPYSSRKNKYNEIPSRLEVII